MHVLVPCEIKDTFVSIPIFIAAYKGWRRQASECEVPQRTSPASPPLLPPPYVDKYLQFDFYQGGQSHRSYHRVGKARFKRGEEEVITTSSILQCHFKLLFLLLVWGLAIKVTTAWSVVTCYFLCHITTNDPCSIQPELANIPLLSAICYLPNLPTSGQSFQKKTEVSLCLSI